MGSERSVPSFWASGDAYEPFVGRWSRLVAPEFLEWLKVDRQAAWLDVGCGTGALSQAILGSADPSRVVGVDRSVGYVTHTHGRVPDLRAWFTAGDAQRLPVASGGFQSAVSGLVLNFVPSFAEMVSEMMRAVRPEGIVAVYVWDYSGKMQLLRYFWDAVAALDPAAGALDEGPRFPICDPDALLGLFGNSGLRDVETTAIDIETRFSDFDDYWMPFLGGQGPAPSYTISLPVDARNRLRDAVRETLPVAPDGSINLVARAWAVKGHKHALK